jgi:hypothetical protein
MTKPNPHPAVHKPNSGPLLKPRKPDYDYHWGKIFGVIVLVLMLGGVTAYLVYGWLSAVPQSEPEEVASRVQPSNMAEEPNRSEPPVEVEPVNLVQDEPLPKEDTSQLETGSLAKSSVEEIQAEEVVKPLLDETIVLTQGPTLQPLDEAFVRSELLPDEIETPPTLENIEPDISAEMAGESEYLVDPQATLEDESISETVTGVEEAAADQISAESQTLASSTMDEPEEELQVRVDPEAELEAAGGPFQLLGVEALEPGVRRFRLAQGILDKEPQGELKDIRLNQDGSAKVWAFSEVRDMRGKRLSYVWLHEGSEVARVRVRIGADHWRSFSSKTLNLEMRGDWRVELQDSEGRLLASADFAL